MKNKMVIISIIMTGIGLTISAIGVSMFRYYSGQKTDEAFKDAERDRDLKLDSINTEFQNTISQIKTKAKQINDKLDSETSSIIQELKTRSNSSLNSIEQLEKETKKASSLISKEIEEIKEITEIKLPIKINAYKDVQSFLKGLMHLFKKMYDDSVPIHPPVSFEEFVDGNYLIDIYTYLDINSNPNVTGFQTYEQYIRYSMDFSLNKGAQILNRYPKILDAETYNLIFELVNSDELQSLKNLNHQKMLSINPQTPPVLDANCITLNEKHKSLLKRLYTWCIDSNATYRKNGVEENLTKIYKIRIFNKNTPNRVSDSIRKKTYHKLIKGQY